MIFNYKRIFDAVSLEPEQREQIRSELSLRCYERQTDYSTMKFKLNKKLRMTVIVAAVIAVSTMLVGFTYGSQIIRFLGGGFYESVQNGNTVNVRVDTGFDADPAEVRSGKVYFILDGSDTDITSYCSEETYYQYEKKDDNGYRHVVLIGGNPDNLGWAEFLFDENGKKIADNAEYKGTYNPGEVPAWLELGRNNLNGG